MICTKKIKAGALQFVLFIGTIVALLLLSFVLVSYSHNLFHKKTDILVNVIQAADSGLEYSFTKPMQVKDILQVPPSGDLGIDITIEKSYWGVLEIRKSKAQKGKISFEKWGIVGHSNEKRHALYLKDNQRPLVLVGKTKITGTAFLPQRGIKAGNILGYSYNGTKMVYGEQKKSNRQLPRFDTEVQEQIDRLTAPYYEPLGESIPLKKEMILKHSFKEPTKIIKGDFVTMEKMELSGNIIVWASHTIQVNATSQLHDVVLIAPQIEIESQTNGNFQALASKSITIGKNCNLNYPTVLLVNEGKVTAEQDKDYTPGIFIAPNAEVRGTLVYQSKSENLNHYKPHIKIDKNAAVFGEVHSTENVELKGSVIGGVTAGAFVAVENGSNYQNHLYNGVINSSILPMQYAGIPYQGESINQVSKWLY